MNTYADIEKRLWNYIDGLSTATEKMEIEELLQTNQDWKAKYTELFELNTLLHTSELDAPSMRFTKTVMEEVAKMQPAPVFKKYINRQIIWGISFFFIAMMLAILIYGFGQMLTTGGSAGETAISKGLGKINFSNFFNNSWVNGLLMVNVVIGLFLFDYYLSTKKKNFQKT